MLEINIPDNELWTEEVNEFMTIKGTTLKLEHSLVSLQKWESKWNKPYLTKDPKTFEENIDYIRCMTINNHVDPMVYYFLTEEDIKKINAYVEAPMTATTFNTQENNKGIRKEQVTAELVYYWMIALNIPYEYRKWHLNQLLTLINVCSIKNAPPKKRSKADIMRRNTALNAARRRRLNSRG